MNKIFIVKLLINYNFFNFNLKNEIIIDINNYNDDNYVTIEINNI